MTLYEIVDWNNSEIILLSMEMKAGGRTVFTEELILSKEIHTGRDVEV